MNKEDALVAAIVRTGYLFDLWLNFMIWFVSVCLIEIFSSDAKEALISLYSPAITKSLLAVEGVMLLVGLFLRVVAIKNQLAKTLFEKFGNELRSITLNTGSLFVVIGMLLPSPHIAYFLYNGLWFWVFWIVLTMGIEFYLLDPGALDFSDTPR